MKILLILVLTFPAYSQIRLPSEPIPCNKSQKKSGRVIVKAIKRFKPAYKKAQVICSDDGLVLALELKNGPSPQRVVDVVGNHLRPQITILGLDRLLVEGQYWDKNHVGTRYGTAPATVVTTRTGSTRISTVTGGHVTEHKQYDHRRRIAIAIVEPLSKNSL